MVGLYTASTLYHCLNTGVKGRIALRKYDHISIYFLIAGSYTPICLIVLPQEGGLVMLAAVWGVALAGTVITGLPGIAVQLVLIPLLLLALKKGGLLRDG